MLADFQTARKELEKLFHESRQGYQSLAETSKGKETLRNTSDVIRAVNSLALRDYPWDIDVSVRLFSVPMLMYDGVRGPKGEEPLLGIGGIYRRGSREDVLWINIHEDGLPEPDPQYLLDQASIDQLQDTVAHELAHWLQEQTGLDWPDQEAFGITEDTKAEYLRIAAEAGQPESYEGFSYFLQHNWRRFK